MAENESGARAIELHPKVILIGFGPDDASTLRAAGINARWGSFGGWYRTGGSRPSFVHNFRLPNLEEQEIVVVNLTPSMREDALPIQRHQTDAELRGSSVIDPVPRAMQLHEPLIGRILDNGGVVVVFGEPVRQTMYRDDTEYGLTLSNWGFLDLERRFGLTVRSDRGTEISVERDDRVSGLLRKYLKGASFTCTYNVPGYREPLVVASSKYEDPVGLILTGGGVVLLLPQLREKVAFVTDLILEILPGVVPALYGSTSAVTWPRQSIYELPQVAELEQRQHAIRQHAEAELAMLDQKIEEIRAHAGHVHSILIETGPELVRAVRQTLLQVGFQKVDDVDEQEATDRGGYLSEDLRIEDRKPTLLVEVKGIVGLPTDEDALQAQKYVAPRMKEWGHTKVQALSLINHERVRPALERQNAQPFRDAVLENAARLGLGLMTTWDLFRLARSQELNGWPADVVLPIFYRTGRIEPIPEHYQEIGVVERRIDNLSVLGIKTKREFAVGVRLGVGFDDGFREAEVESLELDGEPIEKASPNTLVGVKIDLADVPIGARVFRAGPLEPLGGG